MPRDTLEKILRQLRDHGDALLILAILAVIAYAAFLFSQFLYPPLFVPKAPPVRKPAFNRELYEKVINRLQNRKQRVAEHLSTMPQNPFRDRVAQESVGE